MRLALFHAHRRGVDGDVKSRWVAAADHHRAVAQRSQALNQGIAPRGVTIVNSQFTHAARGQRIGNGRTGAASADQQGLLALQIEPLERQRFDVAQAIKHIPMPGAIGVAAQGVDGFQKRATV